MLARCRSMLEQMERRRAAGIATPTAHATLARRMTLTFRRQQPLATRVVERGPSIFLNVNPLLQVHLHRHMHASTRNVSAAGADLRHSTVNDIAQAGGRARSLLRDAQELHVPASAPDIGTSVIGRLQPPISARTPLVSRRRVLHAASDRLESLVSYAPRQVSRLCVRVPALRRAGPGEDDLLDHFTHSPLRMPASPRRAMVTSRVTERHAAAPLSPMRAMRRPALVASHTRQITLAQDSVTEPPSIPRWANEQRRVALVWRKAASGAEALTTIPSRAPLTATPAMPAYPTPASAPIETQALRTAQLRTSQPVFDAATVDRLTDDVVRKIEKRVRIERERQGL